MKYRIRTVHGLFRVQENQHTAWRAVGPEFYVREDAIAYMAELRKQDMDRAGGKQR